ncbi:pyridoxamine 5'-phosphate oxidase family protein [Streptomyces sp. HNM0574]|uniref:pyridoxamine 5'-phosphate oxidase family protein n=1 Tax=Streptomyces sp. HNM0574 TaxID=2714954 RepID=UPI00146D3CCE|nr:pyridoxamine 5'-phosphate oxidase family protein [Streptomyces sp. HNM0574]NLU68964.1 pyridoxamine 5'-phosphate oxidase family protein [Streptomyces sp. HNM0574]
MRETSEDLEWMRRLLDDSYAKSGAHTRSIIGEDRRLDTAGVVEAMRHVRVMALATTTSRGEPRVGPVDGLLYRGRLHFGSDPGSFRFRHIRARPAVSASVIDRERLQITVHGTAHEVDPAEDPGLLACLVEEYGQAAWDRWMRELSWARIEPRRMLTFTNPPTEE